MENSRPIQFGFEDIKRYKQGLMSKDEMFAFEKASMEDPFLADALEGYMQADITLAEEHLSNIQQKIANKEAQKEKAVVVAMPKRSFAMWRVAAMVIVIAGAGLLTYKLIDKDVEQPGGGLARTEETISPDQTIPGAPINNAQIETDSNKLATPALANDPLKESKTTSSMSGGQTVTTDKATDLAIQTDDLAKTKEIAALKDETTRNNTAKNKVVEEKKRTAAIVTTQEEVAERSTANNKQGYINQSYNNEIRGRVLNPSNEPLANANVKLDNSNRTVTTDNAGNFTIDANDTLVTATVASQGYDNTRVQLRSNSENTINLGNISLQPDPAFNDIAVIGLGNDKQRVTDTISNKPVGGWESFQQYVAKQLNYTIDTTGRNMRVTRELELEFFVDAKGNPKNFKVLHSTDEAINQKAIEAVKKGPKWATKRKKARLLIRY